MKRSGVWIMSGLAVLAAALPLVLRAAPQPPPPAAAAKDQVFAALCKDGVVEESRPDPAWVLASYEGDNCRAPVMPTALNGRTATHAQIMAGMAAVADHAGRARAFEACVANAAVLRKTAATASKSFLLVETHRILVSEKNRRLAASRMAAAINAFNAYGSECAEE